MNIGLLHSFYTVFLPLWVACAVTAPNLSAPVMAQTEPKSSAQATAKITNSAFEQWLQGVIKEAVERGFSEAEVQTIFAHTKPLERIVELDRRQPEFTQTFWSYLDSRVSANRIEKGRRLLLEHADLLEKIEEKYSVQGRFLIAFWGLETNFGQFLGGFPVIDAVATLAYDERRSEFFRSELFHALDILSAKHIPQEEMMGSWAGAMGQPQFMPSTFVGYAVDENGDGRKDIWGTLPDVFGSAANYLSNLGWDQRYTWGREVLLPSNFDLGLVDQRAKKPLKWWQEVGIRRIDGIDLPSVDIEASVILPAGVRGPAFLVYGNFDAILSWNRSLLYAVSVGHLADRLIGIGSFQSPRNPEEPLSRDQVLDLQTMLNALGYNAGQVDGRVGPRTRAAVRAFQKTSDIPADGHLDGQLYETVMKSPAPKIP